MSNTKPRPCPVIAKFCFLFSLAAGICYGISSWPDGTELNSIAFGNGVFVAVGYDGAIFSSSDGISWNERASGTKSDINAVAFGNNRFVAVGWDGVVLTSADGATWTKKDLKTTDEMNDVTFGAGIFVVVCRYFSRSITDDDPVYTSADGEVWTMRSTGMVGGDLDRVVYGNNRFYAAGQIPFMTSADGITWSTDSLGRSLALYAMTYGNNHWIALSDSGNFFKVTRVYTAAGDSAWKRDTSFSEPWGNLNAFGYVNDRFIAVSAESLTVAGRVSSMWTSTDGVAWTKASGQGIRGYGVPYAMAYGNGKYVFVGSNGLAAASSDGITWTSTTLQSHNAVLKPSTRGMHGSLKVGVDRGMAVISAPALRSGHPVVVRLFNTAGRTVFSAMVLPENGMVRIRMENLQSGMYLLKLMSPDCGEVASPFPFKAL